MRLLVAEDEPISRRILEARLQGWGYRVVVVDDGVKAWETLAAQDPPRLAILDWMMPQMDGIEVCRRVRARGEEPYIYIILLTARSERDDLVTAMNAGADDFLAKPFDPLELEVRLRAGRRVIKLQEDLIAAREVLRHQATHDALTGVWNRAAILDVLRRETARARRERDPLGVIMADLDRFKEINDAHGHPAGDAVLREAARRLAGAIRPYDSLGRYGGEEFLLVVPQCDAPCTARVAERLRIAVGQEPMSVPGGRIIVTVSLGTASLEGHSAVHGEALIRAADQALYEAKAKGRNRVEAGRVMDPSG
jgi:diguanylate cyclase (GGDEF)-like protein